MSESSVTPQPITDTGGTPDSVLVLVGAWAVGVYNATWTYSYAPDDHLGAIPSAGIRHIERTENGLNVEWNDGSVNENLSLDDVARLINERRAVTAI